jgi:heterodisulfide reductase subunit A-like polyferredoxin
MKIGTFLCNCGGSLKNLDWDELQNFMKEKGGEGNFCVYHESLCSPEGKAWFKETVNRVQPLLCLEDVLQRLLVTYSKML